MPSFWSDATGLLEKIAPVLGSAIGGPLGGIATTAIIDALGLAPDTPPAQINAALATATPDQLLALKQADQNFRATMKQLDVDFAKVNAADRASAREREIATHDHTPAILAYALTAGFFGLVWLMVFHSVPEANAAAVNILLGTLGTAWIAAMGFFFGSNQGSRSKDAMLFQSTPPSTVSQQPAPVAQAIQIEAGAEPGRGPSPSDPTFRSETSASRRNVDRAASAVRQAEDIGEDLAREAQ